MTKRELLTYVLKRIVNPLYWYRGAKHIIVNLPYITKKTYSFFIFFIILIFFMIEKAYALLTHIPLLGMVFKAVLPVFKPVTRLKNKAVTYLEKVRPFQVRQSYLVQIAYGNLRTRTHRTLITIFGMATGIGIIVYLLSLGYGIERLVVSQIASLDELRIVDVVASQNTNLKMNRNTLKKVKDLKDVQDAVPLISLVGRINFQKAQTDVLVYGADEKFLELARLNLKKGKIFTNAGRIDDSVSQTVGGGDVAGAVTTLGRGKMHQLQSGSAIEFNILPSEPVAVWEECSITSEVIGYTVRYDSSLAGKKVWGGSYAPYSPSGRTGVDFETDEYLGNWIIAKMPLFTYDHEDNLRPLIGGHGYQVWDIGCVQEHFVQYKEGTQNSLGSFGSGTLDSLFGSVLGTSTDSDVTTDVLAASASAALDRALAEQGVVATGAAAPAFETVVVATDSAGVESVRLVASDEAKIAEEAKPLSFQDKPMAQAVISTGLMKLLGIQEKDVLTQTFTVSFIVTESLRPDVKGKQLSEQVTYKIIGLVDDDKSQFFYVPFSDMQKLGVQNFSQLKVILKNESGVAAVRTEIESFGYNTSSVVDTVEQISSLFDTLRIVLGAIGLIALAVASLGMFNTLTVSLLERTREIGGMKVIGMVSDEIQDLFLAEAMIMGFSGGVGGLVIGYMFGQVTSILVSVLSIARGLGYLELTYIPLPFVISILVLSFIVGIVTGLYPAKRARSISALNALRYE